MSRKLSDILSKARFTTYCFLSLVSVAFFQYPPSNGANIAVQLLWIAIPFVAIMIAHAIDDIANARYMRCTEERIQLSYTAPLSVVLIILGQFAIWTQTYLAVAPTATAMHHGTDAQVCAIHFAMSFFTLSECEFYRLYWITHRQERSFNLKSLFNTIYEANHDEDFEESRDCISYHLTIPHLEFPPQDGWASARTLKRYLVDPLCTVFFHLVAMACLNYPIKRLSNPDPEGDSFPLSAEFVKIFFTPKYQIFLWFDFQLQRPIRLFNRMLFWSIVEYMESIVKYTKTAWRTWGDTDVHGGELM